FFAFILYNVSLLANADSIEVIVNNTITTYLNAYGKVISYKSKFSNKSFDDNNLFISNYYCKFYNNDDSLYGAYFYYIVNNSKYTSVKLYNGKKIFLVNDTLKF